jgi:uncharacterized protein
MIPRQTEITVRQRLATTSTVVLLGPRQVGKTTLAKAIAATSPGAVYLDLERTADRLKLEDADSYLRQHQGHLVVLDEIHRVPGLFEVLRGIIDERRAQGDRYGHFLLLGSAALDLMRQASESLAGRVSYLDMPPVNALEAQSAAIPENTFWLRGGFPDSLLAPSDAASLTWRQDFVRSYLERDVPMFAPRVLAQTVGRLWTMLAHQQGSMLNQSRLAASLGVSVPAVARYIDLLVDLQLLRRLQPWSGNLSKRIVKAPKVTIRDSGLVHALLDIPTLDALLGHPVCGHSYEGMVIETLIAAAHRYTPSFYRSHDGAEIDLLLESAGKPFMAIEVKRSSAPSLDKGFAIACDDLGLEQRYVVYPGQEQFPLRHGARAIGLVEMARLIQGEQAIP